MSYRGDSKTNKTWQELNVHDVRLLYMSNYSQDEVAQLLGTSQRVIYRFMLKHHIPARPAIKRFQCGSANAYWSGDSVGYKGAHNRVEAVRGRPRLCVECKTTSASRYEWANLTGNYKDPHDYKRLCRSCHIRFDNSRRRGSNHLLPDEVRAIRTRMSNGERQIDIARDLKINPCMVNSIARGRTYSHV